MSCSFSIGCQGFDLSGIESGRGIADLAEEIGFESGNGGKLSVALYAEALGMFAVWTNDESDDGAVTMVTFEE